ncbi:MAG TPA: hypothetical protein VMN57_10945 [Anaerolineales bacterium]|nr:hypothetical protein [Anaerolineales bacterium]
MFEDLEDDEFLDDDAYGEGPGARDEAGNRTFIVAAIALGALSIIGLICVGVYLWFNAQSGGVNVEQTQQAAAFAQQTQEAEAVQMTIAAQSWTATPTDTPVATETSLPTQVVAVASPTDLAEATEDPATATIAALLTQAAAQGTPDSTALASITVVVTGLPQTGFFDDFGVNGLIVLAFFALVVIFLARRLRTASR